MDTQTINGHPVDVVIIAADGATRDEPLTPRERWTVAAVDAVLKGNPAFQAAYPGAQLVRVDANRSVAETRQGRYYLRYQYAGGATELWGYLSRTPRFDFKEGVVGVVATPAT